MTGKSKGKGIAGVMKRHGFKGLSASHGTQRKHRSPGSIGACATPARVFKGVRMAGRMGAERTTVQSLTVHAVDSDKNLLLIKGAVPGPRGGLVVVRSAARGGELMSTVNVVSPSSEKAGTVELPDAIFGAKVNVPLMHQVVVAQRAAARQGTHATKTRGKVSGGGRKPYRQKGTGRARQGSIRAPQFTGGGVVARPGAARLQPEDAEEDEGRGAARRAVRPGRERARVRRHRVRRGRRAADQGRAGRAGHRSPTAP